MDVVLGPQTGSGSLSIQARPTSLWCELSTILTLPSSSLLVAAYLEHLAETAKVNRRPLERILRYCFTIRNSRECQTSGVSYTALSAVILTMLPWIRISSSEMVQKGFLKMPYALQIWSDPP